VLTGRLVSELCQICSPSAVNRGDFLRWFSGRVCSGSQPQDRLADFVGRVLALAEKTADERGFEIVRQPAVFKSLKFYFLQGVLVRAIFEFDVAGVVQSLNPRQGTVDDASEFRSEFGRAVFQQALFRFRWRKPGGITIRFLGRFEAGHFAQVSGDSGLRRGGTGNSSGGRSTTKIAGKGHFLHSAVNASLFNRFESCGLGVGQAGFDAAFRENPTSVAGLNQEEFDAGFLDTITNGGDLLASFRKPRPGHRLC